MAVTQDRGRAGENLAASYLALAGIEVVQRNAKLAGVEVDLVARDGPVRVLVEVKLRTRPDYGGAAAAVDWRKCERLRRAALALTGDGGGPVRVDVIAIERNAEGLVLRHLRDAVGGG